jgi:hypothetical protein
LQVQILSLPLIRKYVREEFFSSLEYIEENRIMKHLKKYNQLESKVNEGFWDSLFGKPTIDDAAHDSMRGQGWSHRGKDEENYIMFKGQKFYPDQIQYDEYNSTKEIPRVENGKLIVANPAWSL